jgi:RHS repeat-associated protein
MPARKYSIANTNYRYGFNGKENDNDIENGAQDYGMRIYDGRLGRFLSVDPIFKKYAELTPYQFASNTPTQAIDLDGLEAYYIKTILPTGKTLVTIITDVKIADFTGSHLTHNQINAYGEKFKHALENGYKFTDKSSNTTYNLIVRDIKVVNTFDEKKDFGFELVDWGGSGVLGETESIGNSKVNNMKISITGQGKSGMDRTVAHEFGHVLGLRHPKDEKDGDGDAQSNLSITESPDNLMRQTSHSSGRKLLLKQIKIEIKTIDKDKGGYTIDLKKIYRKVTNYFKTNYK